MLCAELQDSVLSRIPFTNLSELEAHVTGGDEALEMLDEDTAYNVNCEFAVAYEVPGESHAAAADTEDD